MAAYMLAMSWRRHSQGVCGEVLKHNYAALRPSDVGPQRGHAKLDNSIASAASLLRRGLLRTSRVAASVMLV